MGMPPTGKSVDVQLIDIMGFDDAGLVCEHWGVVDMLSMLQQLGAVPEGLAGQVFPAGPSVSHLQPCPRSRARWQVSSARAARRRRCAP